MSQYNGAVNPAELPWAPVMTTTRSGKPELTQHGIVYVWSEDRKLYANAGRSLLRIGDTRFALWTRSLLKPFQLMALLPTVVQAYPQLTDEHLALLMASQQGDAQQLEGLRAIMAIGGLTEAHLQCPACTPMRGDKTSPPSPINHPCCGKHLAHLLYMKAKGLPLDSYLQPEAEPYGLLMELLGYLLNRDDFEVSADGCGMPNVALSAVEIAQLYHALVMPVSRDLIRQCPDELTDMLEQWDRISSLMRTHAGLIGGMGRLDTRLMDGALFNSEMPQAKTTFPVIAKEGADGLLCVGIGPNPTFADGLGVLVKLAAGYDPKKLEVVIGALLEQLDLKPPAMALDDTHSIVQTHFHFNLREAAIQA